MSEELVFMMGQFSARFPLDRLYARNHMWALPSGEGFRFGFTAYAVRLLQDVYFLEWFLEAPAKVKERQAIGAIESSKAESELYAPVSGQLKEFNSALLKDPSAINVDGYNAGWLFSLIGEPAGLMKPSEYMDHLAAAWEIAQRTIKGQVNET